MKRYYLVVIICLTGIMQATAQQHPCLYATNNDKAAIQAKIKKEPWAAASWKKLLQDIDKYVDRHVTDPNWITSRLAMYWKEGAHYTQCYLKDQNWDYGEGNAPVPTVRLPGMRVWNDYVNVPLEERTPYNETGDMKARSRKNPSAPVVVVPYKNTGHLIRGNNNEILTLAEKAAFAYWITGQQKYAQFAADIFNTWVIGIYYMNPPYDPSFMKSGYDPGGIFGFYDYEQIHDDLAMHAAPVYDFLYDYLSKHPHPHLKVIGKNINDVAATVFKRFIDIGFIRGGKNGNWNVNGWNVLLRPILVLGPDNNYPDKKGRDYYLHYFISESTRYHDALPDILKAYDPATGLWPESPGYALGTISSLLDLALPVYLSGTDIVHDNPIMQKAALAVFPWMDARGNVVVFGDGRGGPGDFTTFERLLTYYTWKKDGKNAAIAATAIGKGIQSGQYDRSKSGWTDLCINVPKVQVTGTLPVARTAYSAVHEHLIMKNGNDEQNGLMFTLYGGVNGKHLSPNGLALQLYGKGWALAPDASAYESYWSADHAYHQSATGVNTILPGYTAGPITINAMEPAVAADAFTSTQPLSPWCSFADVSAQEKRRVVGMIRTSSTTGYYIDIFRSDLPDNDYLWHNLGNSLLLTDTAGKPLPLAVVNDLDSNYNKGYVWFKQQQKAVYNGDLHARWTISTTTPSINMDMWMMGQQGRQVYTVQAPPTTLNKGVTPGGVCMSPQTTPTLIVRQLQNNAWQSPFVAVFESYNGNSRSIKQVTTLAASTSFTALKIESNPLNADLKGRKEYVLHALTDSTYQLPDGIAFKGSYAIIAVNESGFQYLYLGKGKLLQWQQYKIAGETNTCASLYKSNGAWVYSSNTPVSITLPAEKGTVTKKMPAAYNRIIK